MEVVKTTGDRALDEELNRMLARIKQSETQISAMSKPSTTPVPAIPPFVPSVPAVSIAPFDNGNSGAGTVDLNYFLSNNQIIILTGNCTFTFSGLTAGYTYTLKLIQDATGSRTVTWPGSGVAWQGGSPPTLTATALLADLLGFYYDGATMVGYIIVQGF